MLNAEAKTTQETTQETTKQPVKHTINSTTQETAKETVLKIPERILAVLARNAKANRKEIAKILGDITEDGVKYHLEKLKERKMIKRVGSTKSGYWKILKNSNIL